MPIKRFKKEDESKLVIGLSLYAKRFNLVVDKKLCKGCNICKLVCPREAITIKPTPRTPVGNRGHATIDIDEKICDFHAICAATCPFGAITITVNEEPQLPTVEKEAYPSLVRNIHIQDERCDPNCNICEKKCPLGIITVTFEPLTAKEIEERKAMGLPAASTKTKVNVKKELCASCGVCEIVCPARTIHVTKFFDGSIRITPELCPDKCHNCLDVCPVNALSLGKNRKVCVEDRFCIYCGACENVCPNPPALQLTRIAVRHTPIKSGAWNKALEKLTSTSGLNKELRIKKTSKARDAIKNLNLAR